MGKKKTVQELCVEYGSDKTPEIRHTYAPKYDELFEGLKNVKKVLEIGVGHPGLQDNYVKRDPNRFYYPSGVSLRVWRGYFPEAMVYGIDINPEAMIIGEERIQTIIGDSNNEEFVSSTMKEIGPVDIIIDDGDHRSWAQIATAQLFIPHVKNLIHVFRWINIF